MQGMCLGSFSFWNQLLRDSVVNCLQISVKKADTQVHCRM